MKKLNIPINPVMTNADRIRSMTDEELAKWLDSLRYGFGCELCANVAEKCDENCVEHFVEWIKQPAEKGRSDE